MSLHTTPVNLQRNWSYFLAVLIGVVFIVQPSESKASSTPTPTSVRLSNHVPHKVIAKSKHIGRSADKTMTLSIAVALRDEVGLQKFISHVTDPKDPLYGQYLTPAQVLTQFGPSADDMTTVEKGITSLGLKVTGRMGHIILVEGTTRNIEKAFAIELHDYTKTSGEAAFSTITDPLVPSELSSRITMIAGLENIVRAHHHAQLLQPNANAKTIGSGALGGVAPTDIAKAYNINAAGSTAAGQTGTGQTLALYELDGYSASDISQYVRLYNLATTPKLTNVLVDGFNGSAGSGAIEVTLDIELMAAVAPGASQIIVYEGPNTTQGALDTYAKIQADNLAPQVSTSWGLPEDQSTAAALKSENTIFMMMAAAGQTLYAAAGDSGAYDDGTNLSTDDPASQPFVTGVGGTTLSTNADGTFKAESSWGIPAVGKTQAQGGGGGISSTWPLPNWQSGFATTTNKGSSTMRMIPDVSLNADPNTGYAIVFQGVNGIVGGTSCAAPIWTALTALINQKRSTNKLPNIGFINSTLYQLGQSNLYSQIFHDVNDGSTNLFYPAVTGYDLSTGLGSPNFSVLFNALTSSTLPPLPPTTLTAKPFNQIAVLNWTASAGASTYAIYRGANPNGPFTALSTNLAAATYIDVNLTNSTTYYYYVTATDTLGTSANSAVISVTPALVAPEAPTSFTYSVVP